MVLDMLRNVVSEQQDDWDECFTFQSVCFLVYTTCQRSVRPYHMFYGIEMTLPLDFMLGDAGPDRLPMVRPNEYVECLRGAIQDAHIRAQRPLKDATSWQKHYGVSSRNVRFISGDWVWCQVYPRLGGKLVLAKPSPVTYKIQWYAAACQTLSTQTS